MLELNMNGKRLSDNDIVVLISKDGVQNVTEVKFFTDEGEVVLDDITAAIDININIVCDENARQRVDGASEKKSVKSQQTVVK